jgi:predicted ester cyclase
MKAISVIAVTSFLALSSTAFGACATNKTCFNSNKPKETMSNLTSNRNKEIVRRYFQEALIKSDDKVIDELIVPNFVDHHLPPGFPHGPKGVKIWFGKLRKSMADRQLHIQSMVAEGDLVTMHFTMKATQVGEYMGMPATNKRFESEGFALVRVMNGQIIELWEVVDRLKMLQQLGHIPARPVQGSR